MAVLKAPFIGAVALGWLERDARARLIVDDNLRVIWGNQRAYHAAPLIGAISLDGNVLAIKDPDQHEKFKGILTSLEGERCVWWASNQPSAQVDAVSIVRLQSEGNTYFAIELYTDNPDLKREYLQIWDRFKLTYSEQEVLQRLLDGKTPQEISAMRKVGLDTVRAHIRAIYAKIDVCNREQLFSRLSIFHR